MRCIVDVRLLDSEIRRAPSRPVTPRRSFGAIGMAASAGGVQALISVVSGLPASLGAAVVVLQHVDAQFRSRLVEILARAAAMPVGSVRQGDRLAPGRIVVAPPGDHLVVGPGGVLSLERTPAVHFVRPAADRLFGSLATSFGARAAVVVLTGTGRDGAAGVSAVKRSGGRVIVQDEASSDFFGMPGAAIATGDVDHVVPLEKIAGCLIEVVDGWQST